MVSSQSTLNLVFLRLGFVVLFIITAVHLEITAVAEVFFVVFTKLGWLFATNSAVEAFLLVVLEFFNFNFGPDDVLQLHILRLMNKIVHLKQLLLRKPFQINRVIIFLGGNVVQPLFVSFAFPAAVFRHEAIRSSNSDPEDDEEVVLVFCELVS